MRLPPFRDPWTAIRSLIRVAIWLLRLIAVLTD